jgi:hypothetical protein
MGIHYERVLPHWQPQERWLFVTCCLFGALPVLKQSEEGFGLALVGITNKLKYIPHRLFVP